MQNKIGNINRFRCRRKLIQTSVRRFMSKIRKNCSTSKRDDLNNYSSTVSFERCPSQRKWRTKRKSIRNESREIISPAFSFFFKKE